jgi:hypothetical protein
MRNPHQATRKINLGVQKRGKVCLPTFNWQIDLAYILIFCERATPLRLTFAMPHTEWIN